MVEATIAEKFDAAVGCETFARLPDGRRVIRFVTSWATRAKHVDEFLDFAATVA